MKKSINLTLSLLFFSLSIFSCEQSIPENQLHYKISVILEPESQTINAEVTLLNPPASRFYLNKNFKINEISADNQTIAFLRDTSAAPLRWTPSLPIVIEKDSLRTFSVKYSGKIMEIINGVNMISADLVELALYSAWYPLFEEQPNFSYDLTLDLPSEMVSTTNGKLLSQEEKAGRTITKWQSFQPGMDLAVVASPKLHLVSGKTDKIAVEMFYHTLSADSLQAKIDNLCAGMEQLTQYYGEPQISGMLRFVYSPRGGWGYSRIPLFIVSEDYAKYVLTQEFGNAQDFHGGAHEMSHFWWLIADVNTPDDWINEGLAEFSAFRLSSQKFGKPFADHQLKVYSKHISESKTDTPIAETTGDSPDRYVNRYEKTTIMFLEAQQKFGENNLDRVLKALHKQYAGTRALTTAIFLDKIENELGEEALAFFRNKLYEKGQKTDQQN